MRIPCLEHELTQHHTEDKNDQENDDRNEEQDFGDRARARCYSGKTEETGDDGNDEENDSPYDHGDSLARVSDRAGGPAQLAYLSWHVVAAGTGAAAVVRAIGVRRENRSLAPPS